MNDQHQITTAAQLDALYGAPRGRSLTKELDYISASYRKFIEAAPFVIVATSGSGGLDCSPRGDPPGFVRLRDDKTVLIPDRRGNNRIETLRNLIEDPRISLLFLIPGVGETLRINGRAAIVTDPALCASFEMQGKAPVSVLVVTAERVYFQCPKALVRSRLWSAEAQVPRSELPSSGDIMAEIIGGDYDAEAHDSAYPQHQKNTLY
jgi:hypothetical protein